MKGLVVMGNLSQNKQEEEFLEQFTQVNKITPYKNGSAYLECQSLGSEHHCLGNKKLVLNLNN